MHTDHDQLQLKDSRTLNSYQLSSLIACWGEQHSGLILQVRKSHGGFTKGPEDGDKCLAAFLKSVGYAKYTIQHDKDPVLRALVWNVVERPAFSNGRIHVRETPKNCRRGSGPAERYIGELSGVARALRAEQRDKSRW